MKKYLIALLLGGLLVLALATVASADNGPHGSFTADTAACAGCHRVHTARYGSNALLIASPEALCATCHAGLGAGTDVEDGRYVSGGEGTVGGSLLAGGFTNALMAHTWSGKYSFDAAFNATPSATTSHHNLGTSGTVWGSGANNSTPGTYVLECTSCHDPHGNAGWNISTTPDTRVASYRLLRWQPQGSDGFTAPATSVNWSGGAFPSNDASTPVSGWLVPDNYIGVAEWYTIGTDGAFANGDYQAGGLPSGTPPVPATGNANAAYRPGTFNYVPAAQAVSYFCAQCHDRYFNNSRLRNNEDESAYCNGGNPATVPPPTSGTSVSTIDATYCKPFFIATPAPGRWVWGDNSPSGDTTYMYRHTSGDLRASMDGMVSADTRTSLGRACTACHVAHGTSAVSTALASGATLAGDSALLRMDNRSICLRCHAGGVNYTIQP